MGIINAGTAVGGVVAPPMIAIMLNYLNWRWIFLIAGGTGLLWTAWWRLSKFLPKEHPGLGVRERDEWPFASHSPDPGLRVRWH
jgi:MFS family permease